jgi:pyruvate/2-oxoglutarate dehydrogenase complex dihydrolipoamide dehydrogenase (E3) component
VPDAYDLIVVGTGAAGAGPAERCRKAGWRVAVVDDEPYGGTCAFRGCDPKKVLVGFADLAAWYRRMLGYGIRDGSTADPLLVGRLQTWSVRVVRPTKMIQNLWWAAGYNVVAIPLAAGLLVPWGFVLSPVVGAVLMSVSPVIVAINAQLLRRADYRI